MKIGIAGAGGIGSNVARHLAQAGVTSLLLVDFDVVETANLDRQFYFTDQAGRPKVKCLKQNLLGIHPTMNIQTLTHFIRPGDSARIFTNCSLVVEGFDDSIAKKLLMEELAPFGIPVVSASGIAGTDMENIRTRKIGNCHIVGDFSTDVANAPLFAPKIAVIAAMMTGADGVHMGQEDLPVAAVKKLAPRLLVGCSTHSPDQAARAVADGADYIGMGPIFATKTKEDVCDAVGLAYLDHVVANVSIPFVAIGGIKRHNLAQVAARGAKTICLVTEIIGARNIEKRIKEIRQILSCDTSVNRTP